MARKRKQVDIDYSFNDEHREGPDWYRWMDLDTIYYRKRTGGGIYLLVERICVKRSDGTIDEHTPERYPLHVHKKNTLKDLDSLTGPGVPTYILWHRPECTLFCVKRLGDDRCQILNGWSEYWDWLDEFRLQEETP